MFARDERWWSRARSGPARPAGGQLGAALRRRRGRHGVRGYRALLDQAVLRRGSGDSEVAVREVMRRRPAALATLYRYLFDLDLMDKVSLWNRPGRRPAAALAAEPAPGEARPSTRCTSGWWISTGALAARTYAAEVDVVLDGDGRPVPLEHRPVAAGRRPRRCHLPPSTDDDADLDARRPRAGRGLPRRDQPRGARPGRPGHRASPGTLGPVSAALTAPAPWCPVVF